MRRRACLTLLFLAPIYLPTYHSECFVSPQSLSDRITVSAVEAACYWEVHPLVLANVITAALLQRSELGEAGSAALSHHNLLPQ